MELTIGGLASREEFERAGIGLPAFDVARMQRDGRLDPRWVHIGPGNIFRIFIARLAQEMTAAGHRWPVTAVVPLDPVELDEGLRRLEPAPRPRRAKNPYRPCRLGSYKEPARPK